MPSEGINEQSTIKFGVSSNTLSQTDQLTGAWLIDKENAQIAQQNELIEEENERRAAEEPPLDPLPLVPTISTVDEYLVNVLTRAWRKGQGSYVNQCFNEELEASNASADSVRRLDSNEVLAGRSTASPGSGATIPTRSQRR